MPIRGYIIEKYNAMTNAYTCNRLVQEASALDMDLQIVGIHDTVVSPHGVINHGKILEPVDFVINRGNQRYYIQSAYAIPDQAKLEQEKRSLMMTGDFFKRVIITKDTPAPHYSEDGVLIMSGYDFLLNENSLEY